MYEFIITYMTESIIVSTKEKKKVYSEALKKLKQIGYIPHDAMLKIKFFHERTQSYFTAVSTSDIPDGGRAQLYLVDKIM
jgi:hypothetical protein